MRFFLTAAIVAAMFMGNAAVYAAGPSPATRIARLLSGKYEKIIMHADVARAEREHNVCVLHKVFETSAYVQEEYQKANVVVVMKLISGWYPFNEWRIEQVLHESAYAFARELTRRLRKGDYSPSQCEYREDGGKGEQLLRQIRIASRAEIAYVLRSLLDEAKIADGSDDVATRAEIRKAIEEAEHSRH